METLIINIPEKKSALVRQMLKDMGVTIQQAGKKDISGYKQKLTQVSVWSDDDLKVFEESKKAFEDLKPQKW